MTADEGAAGGWLQGHLRHRWLDNGLEVVVLENDSSPVVTTALTYRFGARDDPAERSGLAHFLEHMMFKGSASYPAGEVDHRTRRLGGSNNAFTSHDASTYYFSFGRDRWTEALDIEADRMRGLLMAPEEVEAERAVILEEIAMYRAEPWDKLERSVQERLHRNHPYGRPVLGDPEAVRSISVEDLLQAHGRAYGADNAVLVVAGGCGEGAMEVIEQRFSSLPAGGAERLAVAPSVDLTTVSRIELERGEVGRFLLALPAPEGTHPDLPALRVVAAVLGLGRASRLNHRLVEEDELCGWASASVAESQLSGSLVIAAELVPGAPAEAVESIVLEELAALAERPLAQHELDRARRVLLADWVFSHEQVQQQALTLCQAAALFDLAYPAEQLESIRDCSADRLVQVARRYLNPDHGAVVGWSVASTDE
jgi:zinc protease